MAKPLRGTTPIAAAGPPRLLTLPQAAQRWPELGHPSTLYRRLRANELPLGAVVVLGGRPYLRVAVIESWLNGPEVGSGAAVEASAAAEPSGRLRAVR